MSKRLRRCRQSRSRPSSRKRRPTSGRWWISVICRNELARECPRRDNAVYGPQEDALNSLDSSPQLGDFVFEEIEFIVSDTHGFLFRIHTTTTARSTASAISTTPVTSRKSSTSISGRRFRTHAGRL